MDPVGEAMLIGSGKITYTSPPTLTTEVCEPTTVKLLINNIPESNYEIWGLRPEWNEKGELADLWLLRYIFTGKQNSLELNM